MFKKNNGKEKTIIIKEENLLSPEQFIEKIKKSSDGIDQFQISGIVHILTNILETLSNIEKKDTSIDLSGLLPSIKEFVSDIKKSLKENEIQKEKKENKFIKEFGDKLNNFIKSLEEIIKTQIKIRASYIGQSSSVNLRNKNNEIANPATEETLSDVKSVLTDIRNNFENKLFDLTIGGTSYDYSFTIQEANTFYAIPHEVTVGSGALLIIQNISDEDVYICFRNTSSIGAGIKLFPGQTFSIFIKNNPLYVYSLVNNVKINYNFVRLLP